MLRIACILSLMFLLCGADGCTQTAATGHVAGDAQKKEMQLTEDNHERLMQSQPAPTVQTSQERANLIKRLERFNNDTKVSYIYLINYGKVMAHYVVKGKVSSVNSLLTTPEQVLWKDVGMGDSRNLAGVTIASPDLDGSYGSNGDAIFFYTADDTYVEWRGDYMLCDKPLKLTTPPEIVIELQES